MQQVHMGRFDFTRYTYLGHRRLFRKFIEIESGVSAGTGVALAWSLKYFFRSLFNNKVIIIFFEITIRILFFWLKYIDYLTVNNNGTFDASSSYYFIGKKQENYTLSDNELLNQYKGVSKYN